MAIAQRGQIRDRDRARQIRDFSGLLFGKITPTDIDGILEYHNKAWIIIEIKLGDTELPDGQRLCLERLAHDLSRVKPTLLVIAKHYIINPNDDIDVAGAIVAEYQYRKHKHNDNTETVRDLVTRFIEAVDKK